MLTYTGSLLFALSGTGEWDTEDSDTKTLINYQLSGQKVKCVPLLGVSRAILHHLVSLFNLNSWTSSLKPLPVLALDSSSLTYLLPGTYSSTSYSPTSPLNASIFTTSSSLTISTPDSPVGFTSRSYSGSGNVWTGNDWGMSSWKSIYLPNGWYAVLGQGKVLWGAIPEKNLLPMSVSSMGISYVGICKHTALFSSRSAADTVRSRLQSGLLISWNMHCHQYFCNM